jgi:ubiquinone biosynthesis protein Coq4
MIGPIRMARAAKSLVALLRDPDRLDQVFALEEALRDPERSRLFVQELSKDPHIARALARRTRLRPVDLAALSKLPEGSLGKAFASHMAENGLDPAALPYRPSDDAETFAIAHLRETHDIWHAVTGFGADVAGEIGLQAFYLAQIPSPLSSGILAMIFVHGAFFDANARTRFMPAIVRGWLMGARARPLFGVDWEAWWSRPLDDVRRELAIDPAAPDLPPLVAWSSAEVRSARRRGEVIHAGGTNAAAA